MVRIAVNQHDRRGSRIKLGLVGLAIAYGQLLGLAPANSAEQIRFWYPPFGEFTIHIKDLEQFTQGQTPPRLEPYLGQLSPQQQSQVRTALSNRYEIKPRAISNFTYSPIGEMLMRGMGRILQITPKQNGFKALRAALIFSAQSEEGLTVVNVLRQYPVPVIYLDLPQALRTYNEFLELTDRKNAVIAAIEKQAIAETLSAAKSSQDQNNIQDWRQMGKYPWRREKFSYWQSDRQVMVETTLYLPESSTSLPQGSNPANLIVISHGLGANSETLRYLAEHLASHGFAIAALNHPRTNSNDYDNFLADLSKNLQYQEAVQRPRDISYLIDAIAAKVQSDPRYQINTQRVGLIGHSLGGYTVLALAGGRINPAQINQECGSPDEDLASVNVAKILQCRMRNLSNNSQNPEIDLSDRRIQAVLAINPLGGYTLMGRQGIAKIEIPLTIFASGEDLLTPAIPEQFFPFVWLTNAHKYLVTFPKGTHFSFLEKVERGVVVIPANLFGEKPTFTHPYTKAWSVIFFQTHLNNRPEFASYLHNSYMQTIANLQFPVSVTTNFSESQLIQSLSFSP